MVRPFGVSLSKASAPLAAAFLLAALLSCKNSTGSGNKSSGASSKIRSLAGGDPTASDKAYCRLFAKRIHECMPSTKVRTDEQEAARCLKGRKLARRLGKWNDKERKELVRCLSMPDCDQVSRCMRKGK